MEEEMSVRASSGSAGSLVARANFWAYSSGGLVSTPADTNILIIKQKSREYLCLTGAW